MSASRDPAYSNGRHTTSAPHEEDAEIGASSPYATPEKTKQKTSPPSSGKFDRFKRAKRTEEHEDTWVGEVKNALLCPPTRRAGQGLTYLLLVVALWCSLYSVGDDGPAVMTPGGPGFALMALVILCLIAGALVDLAHLPGLLGMLLMGLVLRNVPGLGVIGRSFDPDWSAKLRTAALLVIMVRGGLGMDADALKRLRLVVLRLAAATACVEAVAVALGAMFLLGLPWGYAFMLGAIIAASSPAVVFPAMLSIQERGLGVRKGIPTLIMASASADDVMAITAFGVLFGLTFSDGGLFVKIIRGPLESLFGVVCGVAVGVVLWYLPPKDTRGWIEFRCLLLLLAGVVALFGGPVVGMKAFGALATVICAFVASLGWKSDWRRLGRDPAAVFFGDLWFVLQPILFGLIGAEIDVHKLRVDRVGLGVLTLACGALCRAVTASVVVLGAGFTLRERLFVVLAWVPKATVQAAFASVVVDHAKRTFMSDVEIGWGYDILTISVLSILITAPLGATAIMFAAPRLLELDKKDSQSSEQVIATSEVTGDRSDFVDVNASPEPEVFASREEINENRKSESKMNV